MTRPTPSFAEGEAIVFVMNALTPAGDFRPAEVAAEVRERLQGISPDLLAAWDSHHGADWFEQQLKGVRRARAGRKAYETRQRNKARRFEERVAKAKSEWLEQQRKADRTKSS